MSGEISSYETREDGEIQQGDILRDVTFRYSFKKSGVEEEEGTAFSFPHSVILTQSCDITQHYRECKTNARLSEEEKSKEKHDKILDTILICPAYPLDSFLEGQHHITKNKIMANYSDSPKSRDNKRTKIIKNESENRFHYLKPLKDALPELVIDFKDFHTVPLKAVESIYGECYVTSVKPLYREKLSQRFSNYLSRIGLPDDDNEA